MSRVLLVEDDAWLATLQAEVLQAGGFEVVLAPHATSAVVKIDEQLPDVIVADMLLTGTTALTLLHELQSHSDTKDIPVILCSNLADAISVDELRPYGVRRIIDKTTMHPGDLVAAVRSVLE